MMYGAGSSSWGVRVVRGGGREDLDGVRVLWLYAHYSPCVDMNSGWQITDDRFTCKVNRCGV